MLLSITGFASPAFAIDGTPILYGSSWFGGHGVNVCSNTTSGSDTTCGGQTETSGVVGAYWQCVELAQRFYAAQGWHNASFGVSYAYQIYNDASSLGMNRQANGSITSIVPGDMIIHASSDPGSGGAGHVSIVDSISGSTINVVEQNGPTSNGRATYTWSGGTLTRGSAQILGVVHSSSNTGVGRGSGVYPDGTYLLSSTTGTVYVTAGGAPMAISSWNNVGGSHTINYTLTQQQIDALPQYPANGTDVVDQTGTVYVIAGGAAMTVTSFSNIPPVTSLTHIDDYAITNQLRQYPTDGTVLRDQLGGVYVVSGGAAEPVSSMANIPYTTYVSVDHYAIANQFLQYPADGTTFVDYATGTVYVVAGGAPLPVQSFGNIPPVTGLASLDHWDLANAFLQYPKDATVVRDQAGGIYVVAGGALLAVSNLSNVPYANYVSIDSYAETVAFRSTPADGTLVEGYGSGETFVVNGGNATQTTPNSSATVVDDWAIVHELNGVE